jgi:hypothetical protein
MGDDRKGADMTDLTPRQILDAIRRGLEETWRRIDDENMSKHPKPRERADEFAEPRQKEI